MSKLLSVALLLEIVLCLALVEGTPLLTRERERERERETQTDDLHYPYCHDIDHPYPCLLVEVLVNCAKEKERDEGLCEEREKCGILGGGGVVLVCALERYEKYFTVVLRVKYFTSFNRQIFSQLKVFFKFN